MRREVGVVKKEMEEEEGEPKNLGEKEKKA